MLIKYLIIIKSQNLDISKCHCCCNSGASNECDAGKCGSNTYNTNAIYPGSNKGLACSTDSQVLKIKILFPSNCSTSFVFVIIANYMRKLI
jgi:hypothetical protein